MRVPIEQIRKLREATGAGVMDCQAALEQANADEAQALAYLRAKGLTIAAGRANRPASQGVIELYSHGSGRVGVMTEINTETDFVARSQIFRSFAHEVALQIAAARPLYVREEDVPADVLAEEQRKAMTLAQAEGKPAAIATRIATGKVQKYLDEHVLLRQAYIRDESLTLQDLLNQTIASVGENVVIRKFMRWELDDGGPSEEP